MLHFTIDVRFQKISLYYEIYPETDFNEKLMLQYVYILVHIYTFLKIKIYQHD